MLIYDYTYAHCILAVATFISKIPSLNNNDAASVIACTDFEWLYALIEYQDMIPSCLKWNGPPYFFGWDISSFQIWAEIT